VARLTRGVALTTGVAAVLLVSSCRALRPASHDTHAEVPLRRAPTTAIVSDSATSPDSATGTERQRLLPLRAYMDELSQRQAAIESRLDSIGNDIAQLRRSVEQMVRNAAALQPNTEIPKEDTIVAGAESAPASKQDRPVSLPSLGSNAGVILPDNSSATPSENSGASPKSPLRKKQATRGTKLPNATIARVRPEAQPAQRIRRTTSSVPPAEEKPLFDSAIVALRAGQHADAVAKLSKLLAHDSPRRGEYLYWRAVAYYQMQQLDRAQRDADAAWQLVRSSNSPRRPDLLYLLAELSAEQGERDRARQYLQSLIESFPSSDAAILARRKLQQMAVK